MDDNDKTIVEKLGDVVKSVVDTAASAMEPEVGGKSNDENTATATYAAPVQNAASGRQRTKANKRVSKAVKAKSAKAPGKKAAAKKSAPKTIAEKVKKSSAKKSAKKATKTAKPKKSGKKASKSSKKPSKKSRKSKR